MIEVGLPPQIRVDYTSSIEQDGNCLQGSFSSTSWTYTYNGERNDKGQRHGYGIATLENGDTYRGEYRAGLRHGYGEYTFFNYPGAKYSGSYAENKKNGYGIFVYPDNSRYEGDWKNDRRHGQGCYYYTNGDMYKGEWAADNRHRRGEYVYAEENMRYVGMWRHGKRSGEGKLISKGNYYEGHFRHDRMLGPGTYFFSNGTQQNGEYVVEKKSIIDTTMTVSAETSKCHMENISTLFTEEFITEWRCKNVKKK